MEEVNESSSGTRDDLACDLYGPVYVIDLFIHAPDTVCTRSLDGKLRLAVKTDRLDQTMRIIRVVLICMMGMFVMPVYWYQYIWRDAPTVTLASANNIEDKLSL